MPEIHCHKCGEVETYHHSCKCGNDIASETGWSIDDKGRWICPDCGDCPYYTKKISHTISSDEFKRAFGHYPNSYDEFERFIWLCEKALKKSDHIDWDIIFSCVKDEWEDK